MEYIVVVDTDGMMTGLWSDDLIGLYEVEKGGVTVERASHVEPCDGKDCQGNHWQMQGIHWHVWEADHQSLMSCCAFRHREWALAWEKEEIERRLIEGI